MGNSKGQIVTEYLIILAVVIIISLIAVGIMEGRVGLGSGFGKAASEIEWASKQVVLLESTIYADGVTVIKIQNNADYPLIISKVGVGKAPVGQDLPDAILPGEEKVLTLDPDTVVLGAQGEEYVLEVTIVFYDANEPLLQSSVSGTVYGTYQ